MKKNIIASFILASALAVVLYLCPSASAMAASLSLDPGSGSYAAGDSFSVQVIVSSSDQSINAVSGTLNFPADKLQVVSISKNSTIVNFWAADPTFSNTAGTIHFEGVVLNPGFQGGKGLVLTLYLKAKAEGGASLSFPAGSILANDGQGTDVTAGLSGANFNITPMVAEPKNTQPVVQATTTAPESQSSPVVSTNAMTPAQIVLGTKYGAPAVIGTSEDGRSQVLLTFVAPNGTKIFIDGDTDADGGFSLLVPDTLKRGLYTVTANLIKADGSHSDVSNEITVQIGNIFSDISWEVWVMILLLVAAVIYLVLRVVFHVQKTQKAKVSNKREVREAESLLHKSFDLLRQDLADKQHPAGFKKDIDDIEKVVEDEVKDLEV